MSKYSEKVKARRITDRAFVSDKFKDVKPIRRCKICGLKIRGRYEDHILGQHHQNALRVGQ